MVMTHFHEHGFEAAFDGAVRSLHTAVRGLVVEGDEDNLDIEGLLEVGPEPGNEGIAVVSYGRLWKSIPLDPPM